MARQIINIGTADRGNGDPIRTAFEKANSNFAELYAILAGGSGAQVISVDIIGSVFGDDSTLIVDGVNGILHGRLMGDVEGSIFADDSTKLIDGILGKVVGPIQTSVSNVSISGGSDGQVLTTNGSGVLSWTSISASDTNTTYTISAQANASNVDLRLTGSDASTTYVTIAAGSNITLTRTNASTITVASSGAQLVSAPTHQYGQAGDTAGMLAYDNEYFYWCFQNYVDDFTACWRRVTRSLTSW